MVGGAPSCALFGGFTIGARVALLWQHSANAKCQRVLVLALCLVTVSDDEGVLVSGDDTTIVQRPVGRRQDSSVTAVTGARSAATSTTDHPELAEKTRPRAELAGNMPTPLSTANRLQPLQVCRFVY